MRKLLDPNVLYKSLNDGISRNKEALVIHDNLNVCGGSERLAVTTIDLLTEIGFNVDLATFRTPDLCKIHKFFDLNLSGCIRRVLITNIYSLLGVREKSFANANRYDLVINTHGDLLPFYEEQNNSTDDVNGKKRPINITYCHFPLLPYYIEKGKYRVFLEKSANHKLSDSTLDKLSTCAYRKYNLMMNSDTILTNSNFSARAINQLYCNVEPTVVSPPVDVDKFRIAALSCSHSYRENIVLVVSRFSPDKEIENALIFASLLKNKCSQEKIQKAKIVITGNVTKHDHKYLQFLRQMIKDYELQSFVELMPGVSFNELLELMRNSKVYFHPFAGEPFGISIVEAMASGLTSVVPAVGGSTEFVPREYQYHSIREAAEIVTKILAANKKDKITKALESLNVSKLVSKFSIQNYKDNLKYIIQSSLKTVEQGAEEVVILNKDKRPPRVQ